jgi:hypothetical protein
VRQLTFIGSITALNFDGATSAEACSLSPLRFVFTKPPVMGLCI